MSSTGSNTPEAVNMEEESRKKGARGGKRSVTHLSKSQLARKRANDREAQRNIRQRTKEHIETLEKKVKELESRGRSNSMERVLKRNQELETEIEKLRTLASSQQSSATPPQITSKTTKDLLIPQKTPLDWASGASSSNISNWQATIPTLTGSPEMSTKSSYASSQSQNPLYLGASSVGFDDEVSQTLYTNTPMVTPIWDDPAAFGPNISQSLIKPSSSWAPFHPAFNQPSRFSDLQQSGFDNLMNVESYQDTTCWQSQPATYAWSFSTKLKAPNTYVDQLMFSVIHSQRQLSITADLSDEEILGPSFPSVHVLFNQPGPVGKKPTTMTEIMECYSAVLSSRGFALIPEKLASFMCMYRFVQWQIAPNYQTYHRLHKWQAPEMSQLTIPHPAWMDLVPWGSFRSKVINDQARYDNVEFQKCYASNLSVNFPHDPMKALIFEKGQIMISPMLDRHLSDIKNISMKKPFAEKYPEFRDVCRFEEV